MRPFMAPPTGTNVEVPSAKSTDDLNSFEKSANVNWDTVMCQPVGTFPPPLSYRLFNDKVLLAVCRLEKEVQQTTIALVRLNAVVRVASRESHETATKLA